MRHKGCQMILSIRDRTETGHGLRAVLGACVEGLLHKWNEIQRVGRALPSAPIELTKTGQFESTLTRRGALGTARPTLSGFGQHNAKTMPMRRSGVVLDRSNVPTQQTVEKPGPLIRTKPAAVEDDRTPVAVPRCAPWSNRRFPRGFTLIELLVVIAII